MKKCNKSFEECELAILRMAVDKLDVIKGKHQVQNETTREIISIVEEFIQKKRCVCYGGTAINNILPKQDQFYNKDIEFPDYDFFSPRAFQHAQELADLYYSYGYTEVEAKSGMHTGTYKVFVNFLPVADITYLHPEIFKNIQKESITVDRIHYAPPNFLRMAMFLELSRPMGDVSRWEKVLKRISLLNKHYPLQNKKCNSIEVQRIFESSSINSSDIFFSLRDIFIKEQVVFFGAMAHKLYAKYMPKKVSNSLQYIPDFDVLSNDPKETAKRVKDKLESIGYKNISITKHKPIGELILDHYEILIGTDTIAFIYKPIACHSYNVIRIQNQKAKIATIDTMLSFYLAFLYANRSYHNIDRILCMSQYLFTVQQKNRLAQKGLLKRFSITCYGHQETLEDIRAHKAELYEELKQKKNGEFEKAFLRYTPSKSLKKKNKTKSKSLKTKNKKTSLKRNITLRKKPGLFNIFI